MTGLFISIEDYVGDDEVLEFDKAMRAIEEEVYDFYVSQSFMGNSVVLARGWVREDPQR